MQHSYLLAGITSGKLIRLLAKNGFSVTPKILFRIFFLVQSGIWASFFKRTELRRFKEKIDSYEMPDDPVFIIGHWRTGSTYLHQLMSLDSNLVSPNVFQVSVTDSFLVSEKYYKPVMTSMMSPTRPMDNVALGFNEPQEDEYALIKLTVNSPLESMVFPKSKSYFLLDYDDFMPSEETREKWKEAMNDFCKRISFKSGKRVLLKNPFHSMRIPLLLEMFPKAKFIHIHRHPYEVVPSSIHMWNVVGNENKLKRRFPKPQIKEVTTVLNRLLNYVHDKLKIVSENAKVEISFSQLENNPVGTLKLIYNKLELNYSPEFEARVKDWLKEVKSYEKNKYILSEAEKETIKNILEKHFIYYNYQK